MSFSIRPTIASASGGFESSDRFLYPSGTNTDSTAFHPGAGAVSRRHSILPS